MENLILCRSLSLLVVGGRMSSSNLVLVGLTHIVFVPLPKVSIYYGKHKKKNNQPEKFTTKIMIRMIKSKHVKEINPVCKFCLSGWEIIVASKIQ